MTDQTTPAGYWKIVSFAAIATGLLATCGVLLVLYVPPGVWRTAGLTFLIAAGVTAAVLAVREPRYLALRTAVAVGISYGVFRGVPEEVVASGGAYFAWGFLKTRFGSGTDRAVVLLAGLLLAYQSLRDGLWGGFGSRALNLLSIGGQQISEASGAVVQVRGNHNVVTLTNTTGSDGPDASGEVDTAVEHWLKGETAAARAALHRLATSQFERLCDRNRYRVLANLAVLSLADGNEREAGTLFLRAGRYQPDDPAAIARVAWGRLLLGESDVAEAEAERALSISPAEPVAAWVWTVCPDPGRSLAERFESLPAVTQEDPEVLVRVGREAIDREEWLFAEASLRRARARGSEDEDSSRLLALALIGSSFASGHRPLPPGPPRRR